MFRGKILLIDRYDSMNTLISGYLTASGFEVRSLGSADKLTDHHLSTVHLILLDIDTAGDSLSAVLSRMNAAGVPVIVLTSENDSIGRLTALEMGAADAMSRPLDMAELTARVRAAQSKTLLSSPFANRPPVSFGGLTADITTYRATLDGEPVNAPPRQIAMLYLFISSPDRVFTRAELSRQLGSESIFADKTVNVHVSQLKKALGRYSGNIVTVRGVGYKFSGKEPDRPQP